MLSRAETETASERETREAAEREGAETREELASTREERDEARTSAEASAAELEALRQSQARFELFEDRAGGYRWRLRHRNGNIIADSAEAYASRQKCQQGMHSVMRNALGAEVRIIEPEDPEEAAEEVETEPIEYESQASFELYEDNAGDYRWRLVHDNGNILADSGEGYASKSNAKRAMAGVREHAAAGDYLKIDPAGFEVYRDKAGQWRWRLVHENGNILADSGEGYASRQKARQGLDSVRTNAGDADIEEQ
ncbi:YegP family protein [Natronomonas halophila]|nr:YegP family protein [Natronomonas halophila]